VYSKPVRSRKFALWVIAKYSSKTTLLVPSMGIHTGKPAARRKKDVSTVNKGISRIRCGDYNKRNQTTARTVTRNLDDL